MPIPSVDISGFPVVGTLVDCLRIVNIYDVEIYEFVTSVPCDHSQVGV